MADAYIFAPPCPGGEIGRHARLRGVWPKGYAGSSPVLGTEGAKKGSAKAGPFFVPCEAGNGTGEKFIPHGTE